MVSSSSRRPSLKCSDCGIKSGKCQIGNQKYLGYQLDVNRDLKMLAINGSLERDVVNRMRLCEARYFSSKKQRKFESRKSEVIYREVLPFWAVVCWIALLLYVVIDRNDKDVFGSENYFPRHQHQPQPRS